MLDKDAIMMTGQSLPTNGVWYSVTKNDDHGECEHNDGIVALVQYRMKQADVAREILANPELSGTSLGDDARAVLARFMQSKITLTVGDL
jgi:hypothetical protein